MSLRSVIAVGFLECCGQVFDWGASCDIDLDADIVLQETVRLEITHHVMNGRWI